jgi:hypothetical protein
VYDQGSSPWASESKDAWRLNANAGYQGGDLPPSSGYNPDHLDRYNNPSYSPYSREPQPQPKQSNDALRFDPAYGLCSAATGAAGGLRGACGGR